MKIKIRPLGLLAALFAILICSADLSAQTPGQSQATTQTRAHIKGRVMDHTTGEGVAYATVSITDSLGVPLAAWVADGRGEFDHEVKVTGRYTVSAAALGYDKTSKEIDIEAPATDIGELPLASGIEIEGVVVTAAVPLVEADIDKITYNVQADPEAPVNTLLDMLRKVPLLSVDAEDNVLMQGQSNYKVLVNGKSSSMMDRSFKDVVRSMPAGSIKNIEVITNPPSKYEAEGIGGIINIITQRGGLGGYNGSLNLGADSFGGLNLGGYLNATTGKFSVSGYVSGIMQRRPGSRTATFQENFQSDDMRFQHGSGSSASEDADGVFYNIQASYEIDSLNLLTLSLMGQNFGIDSPSNSRTVISNVAGTTTQEFTSALSSRYGMDFLSGNIDYQRLFKKPDRVFTASYKLSSEASEQRSLTRIDGLLDYPTYRQRSLDDMYFREHTLQLDYIDPLTDKHSIETGVKLILRQNGSDPETSMRPTDSDPWELDPARKNALDYDQYILGVYGAYQFKLNKFSVKAGARLEQTWNDGMFRNARADVPFDNRLFNLVPNITLSYAPKPTNRYTLSYTQRLSRPSIWYLNPYVNDIDPMNVSYGNPELEAEIAHSFNATYGLFGPKNNLNITAGAMFVNNGIERISTADAEGVTTSTYHNIGRASHYSLNAYYSWRPSAKFMLSMNVNSSWVELEGGDGLKNHGLWYNGNMQTRVTLWKGGSAMANVFYGAPRILLQGKGMSYYYYGIGLSQRAFNQKVTFTLSANMPFTKELHYTSVTEAETFYRRDDRWSQMRTVRFNVGWNFGKTQVQVKRARRTITNDDQKEGESSAPTQQM